MEQLSKCYRSVCDWKQLENWKIRETEIFEQNSSLQKQMLSSIVSQQATCLRKFEEAEELSLQELSDWTLLSEEAKTNWSCAKTMIECFNTLTNIALRIHVEDNENNFHEDIERCKKVAARTMEEGLRNAPSEYLNDAILIQYSASGLMDLLNNGFRSHSNVFELSQVRTVL
jgi:PI-3-kinase-related kinase SMG-1